MATFSLSQLRAGLTKEEAIAELKSILEDQGIDTTTWKDGDPAQNFLQLQAYVYSELSQKLVSYVDSTYNQYASGSALTILADSYFDNQRILSQKTVGNMVLSGSSDLFPLSFQPAELQVTDGTFVFENVNQITLNNAQPYVTASFQGVESSADYNIASNSTITPVETILGLSVTNPSVPGTSTWITTQGVNEESDDVLRKRNSIKWSTLQASELTTDRVKSLALSGSSNVYYVSVDDTNPRGPFTTDVYISRQFTTSSNADLELVQTKFDNVFFGNTATSTVKVTASLATQVEFSSSLTVYRSPGSSLSDLQTNVENTVTNWIGSIPIGGNNYAPVTSLTNVALKNDLIKLLESLDGVETVILSPDENLTFQSSEKLTVPSSYSGIISYVKLNQ